MVQAKKNIYKSTPSKSETDFSLNPKMRLKALEGFILKKKSYPFLIIIGFAVVLYFQTFFFGFTKLDDTILAENIAKLVSNFSFPELFKVDALASYDGAQFYRPLQVISLAIDAKIFDGSAFGYHFFNVLFHVLTCCSLFVLLQKLNFSKINSLFSAVLYSVHPLFTTAVAWMPSRGDLLIALFGVLSFITLIEFFEKKKILFGFLHALCFALALLSKESTILFPVIYFTYYAFVKKQRYSYLRLIYLPVSMLRALQFIIC